MAAERKTLSAQVDADSDLAREFEEYREERSMNSKSEAVRVLVRKALEEQAEQNQRQQAAPGAISGYARTLAAHLSAYAVGTGVLTIVGVLAVPVGTVTAAVFLAGSLALMLAVHVEFSIAGDQA